MKFTQTLKNNYEFRRLYSKGSSAAAACLVVYARKSRRDTNGLGITVSTKVGKAVVRNKIRRRIREIYRLSEADILRGTQLVVVARPRAAGASYAELRANFLKACGKLGILKGEDGA